MSVQLTNLVTIQKYVLFLEEFSNVKQCMPNHWDTQLKYPHLPVTWVSSNDADAYASWRGTRLPTEQEWLENRFRLDGLGLYEWTSTVDNGVRVARGGAFSVVERFSRCAFRFRDHPGNRNVGIGFRVVVPNRNVTAGEGGVAVGGSVHGNISIGRR